MLRKLIRHELRATGRVMGPMLLLVLAAAVGGNLSTNRLLEAKSGVLHTLGIVLLAVFVLAIVAACILAFALMVQRFYRNLLRDEGYLTMTLPVSVHEHIWAKLLTSLIWWMAVTAAVAAGVFILTFSQSTVNWIGQILRQLSISDLNLSRNLPHMVLFCAELLGLLLVGCACVCLQFYAALAVGHSFTHHKNALSVLGFFVLPMGWSLIQSAAMYLLKLVSPEGIRLGMQSLPPVTQTHLTLLGVTAAMAIPAALYYAITAYFLKNRLNLG